jgi:HTH-type transcriptional repressor of NAD biosynthesis genes
VSASEHGLVIGKFYPPHLGHHHLIRTAASQSQRVTVVVMAADIESIPLESRVAWLRDEHADDARVTVVGIVDNVPVDLADPAVWALHVALMQSAVARATIASGHSPRKAAIDVVFTSEAYGAELARRFGARHVMVDGDRGDVPISGTAVRSDVAGHWQWLAAATKAGLACRIVVLGAESTGSTTLSRHLAVALSNRGGWWSQTQWVGEYGRQYTDALLEAGQGFAAHAGTAHGGMADLIWTEHDFVHIAQTQNRREDDLARRGGPVLVCDTDAFATGVWHERYRGSRSRATEAQGDTHDHALYLLTSPTGVPFEQDGTRDGEHLREWMHDLFVERLTKSKRRFEVMTGSPAERLRHALTLIDEAVEAYFHPS